MRYMLWMMVFLNMALSGTTQEVESIITKERVTEVIGALASDSMMGRGNFQKGLDKAADYITVQFERLSLQPLDTFSYRIPFLKSKYGAVYLNNLIGVIPGRSKPDEWVLITAHYDHVGTEGKRRDTIFNGANDNASGTTAVLMLAEYFAHARNNERTLVFCCFAGEELGLVGSTAFAKLIDTAKVKAMVNIEMIGRFQVPYGNSAFVTGDGFSNLFSILKQSLQGTGYHLYSDPQENEDKEAAARLFYRSDNLPFVYRGIPAHTIMSSTDLDEHYHQKSDELKFIELDHMTRVIRTIAYSLGSLADGTATPGKIDTNGLERTDRKNHYRILEAMKKGSRNH